MVKATCAIIKNSKNQVLLIKRINEPFKDYWAFVSGIGFSLPELTFDEAVIKEVEIDLNTSFHGKYIFSIPIKNNAKVDEVLVYLGTVNESSIHLNPKSATEYRWFELEELKKMTLAFENNDILEKFISDYL